VKRNLWKSIKRDAYDKSLKDMEKMPTADDMKKFDESKNP